MKLIGIYKITAPNGRVYIGKSADIAERINYYKKLWCKGQPILHNSIKKYGWDKHKFEVLCQCNESELNGLEKYYIELFQAYGSRHGMNATPGGDGGSITKGRKFPNRKSPGPLSEDHRRKISESHKGQPSHNKGKPMSEEQKKKISASNKGKKWKISPAALLKRIGRKQSIETIQKRAATIKKNRDEKTNNTKQH